MAMLAGVAVATTGFTVLTASTETSRLQVVGAVDANIRAAYDILVRPKGARTALEEQRGLVRANYLSGTYRGITVPQWEQVKAIPGVEVSAPVAMIGYVRAAGSVRIDITDLLDPNATRQLFRFVPTWSAERGLTTVPDAGTYVYVTKRPVVYPATSTPRNDGLVEYVDGTVLRYDANCPLRPLEVLEDGSRRTICDMNRLGGSATGLTERERTHLVIVQALPDGSFVSQDRGVLGGQARLSVNMPWPVTVLMAAVDPEQEDRLVGLRDAVTLGRALQASDGPSIWKDPKWGMAYDSAPVLISERPYVDESMRVDVERLSGDVAARLAQADNADQQYAGVEAAIGVHVASSEHSIADAYGDVLDREVGGFSLVDAEVVIQSGSPSYDVSADGGLRPKAVAVDEELWRRGGRGAAYGVPATAGDVAFRPATRAPRGTQTGIRLERLGTFDPEKLASFSALTQLPLETYFPPQAIGADEPSRQALGGRPLLPSSNPGGYLASPPLVLTTLRAAPTLLGQAGTGGREDFISAIRVRVAGVERFDAVTRERVRLVAEEIARITGLEVDVTMGSSATGQTVHLPAGKFGRPDLALREPWTKKGVAALIVRAIDRKSLALSFLVIVVCALFLGVAVAAAARNRRTEFAVLACLGWPARRIGALVVVEVALVGLLAGVVGLALSLPLARLFGLHVPWRHALLAVPVGLGLALVAAALPALRAAGSHPAEAFRAGLAPAKRAAKRISIGRLALGNLRRVPGRSLLGAVSLAVPVCGLTLLVAVTWAFHGTVVGTVLGDAVAVRVRGVDTAAIALTMVMGVIAVADVLFLNLRERAAEVSLLRAAGWHEGVLARLVVWEAIGLGLLGGVVGAGAGLVLTSWLAGMVTAQLVTVATLVLAGSLLVAVLASFVPVAMLRRLPMASLLEEE